MARYIVETLDGELTTGKGVDGVKIYPYNEWVSVKESMPIDGSEVLFCDMDGDIFVGYHRKGEPRTHFADLACGTIKNVVAWRKLPTPYVESEEKAEVVISQLRADRDRLLDALDKIRAEIDRQEKWLLQAGYTAYNVDIAFDTIKAVLAESEVKE